MVSNRAKQIAFEMKQSSDAIREMEAAIRTLRMQRADLKREHDIIISRFTTRDDTQIPHIAVHKHDSRPAPPAVTNNIHVDNYGVAIGKYDEQGRFDHVFHDVSVVDRTAKRVEKDMEELQKRREQHGNSIFWKGSAPKQFKLAA